MSSSKDNMSAAKPGHTVEFHGLKGAIHLNGTEGTLVRFLKKEQRWEVRCQLDNKKVNAKPTNLILRRSGGGGAAAAGKRMAPPFGAATSSGSNPVSAEIPPSAWSKGLSSKADQYEWFSNCYQMRCDDDYQWGGCNLHGPYDPDADPQSVSDDFLVYCLLAKRAYALPEGWDWSAFLQVAAKHVAYAFEKSDAQERWGSENVFSVQMGGRSLRYTGMDIYKSPVDQDMDSPEHEAAEEEVRENKRSVQEQVGGVETWRKFVRELSQCKRFP